MKRTLKIAVWASTLALGTLAMTSCYDPTADEIFLGTGGTGGTGGGGGGNGGDPGDTLAVKAELTYTLDTNER